MIKKFSRKLTKKLYFILITIMIDFDKNFPTIYPCQIYQPFPSELSIVKCNFIIIIRQLLRKKRFELLSNPLLVRSTDISIQYFERKFSIDEPHYYFFAITQRMARFYVIFSYFDIYFIEGITNIIFQIFTFSGPGNNLYYIVQSAALINVIYFNFIIYQGILYRNWLSHLPLRFRTDETSFFKLRMISSLLFSNFTVITSLSLLIALVILFPNVICNSAFSCSKSCLFTILIP